MRQVGALKATMPQATMVANSISDHGFLGRNVCEGIVIVFPEFPTLTRM